MHYITQRMLFLIAIIILFASLVVFVMTFATSCSGKKIEPEANIDINEPIVESIIH